MNAITGTGFDAIVIGSGMGELEFARPQAALVAELKERFPESAAEIDALFEALDDAERAGRAIFARRAMPTLFGRLFGFWHGREIEKCGAEPPRWCSTR
jgi:hypothetical protein